ncbi:MAG TPA: 6,7-dimethyl-8-ribityllumazine synthase [Tepidisphaeraceae bacterium]|jgi:6,7-dimethyl-8-ribityllumazine synthase
MSNKPPAAKGGKIPKSARIVVIAARFNEHIVDELLRGCVARLGELGIGSSKISVHRVPGAFELPLAAKWAGQTRKCAAVICLGAVIRGDTPHFDFVAGEAARGIQDVGLELGIPVIFGVLTTNNEEQAKQRIDVGMRSAEAAVEMIALKNSLRKTRL